MENITVSAIQDPFEIETAKQLITTVRFDCLVKMYDFGQIQPKSTIPFYTPKPLPPQWFKSEFHITLDMIREGSPEQIGLMFKQAFQKLRLVIEQYENSNM